jgi:predicted permease
MVVGLATITMAVIGFGSAAWAVRTRGEQGGLGARQYIQTSTRHGTRSALVVCQIALALLLTAGAAVLAVSLRDLQRADMGFAADSITLVKIGLPVGAYDAYDRHLAVFEGLAERVAATPGVSGATPVILSPFVGPGGWDASVALEGQGAEAAAANPTLNLEAVAPGYFAALGVPLYRGRKFEVGDGHGSVPVTIVSQRLARRLWVGEDPIGKRIKLEGLASDSPWLEVVGVAGDTRYRELETPPFTIYVPFSQTKNPGLLPTYLAVRSQWGPGAMLETVRTVAHQLDAGLLVSESASVAELRARPLARPRLMAWLAGAFAVIALGLAAVGVYGMVAMLVVQRTREFGVRMALGAQAASIRRLVLWHAGAHAAGGILIGFLVWLPVSRVLRSVIYGLTPMDPITLAGAAALLLAAAVLASYFPARRATRVDPAVVLRSE